MATLTVSGPLHRIVVLQAKPTMYRIILILGLLVVLFFLSDVRFENTSIETSMIAGSPLTRIRWFKIPSAGYLFQGK